MTTPPDPGLPFDATVAGVRAYVVSMAAEGQRPAGAGTAKRTPDSVIADWIVEASAIVDLRIRNYAVLPVTDADIQVRGQLTQEKVAANARHLVQLYAGALLLDVDLPERSSQNARQSGRGPGAPLMDRFYKLLDDLDTAIDSATSPGAIDAVGAGASIITPPPRFPPGMGF